MMIETSGCVIRALVASTEGFSIHWMQYFGAPAATAASCMIFADAALHFWARGWKPKMITLRPFRAISDLNIVVEVGLVVGVTAATTPNGSAISMMPSFSAITPTDFPSFM